MICCLLFVFCAPWNKYTKKSQRLELYDLNAHAELVCFCDEQLTSAPLKSPHGHDRAAISVNINSGVQLTLFLAMPSNQEIGSLDSIACEMDFFRKTWPDGNNNANNIDGGT
jgi:hypothetical protein